MKRFAIHSLLFILLSNSILSSAQNSTTSLFNGTNLQGWDTYIGPPLDEKGKILSETPVGLNNDPNHVFTVVKQGGEKVIRISGQEWGGISTVQEFENFHLQLMFKWGNLTWGQKKGQKKDSGLLYFAVGEHGADYGAWMRSQEFQIEEGNSGDYWGVAGGVQDIPATKSAANNYVYDPAGTLHTFSEKSEVGRHCKKRGDAEKPSGEWNTLDLYCFGDTSIHVINGKVMMVLYHSAQLENGQKIPLVKGKIQIQSEGAEIFYKGINIAPISALPSNFIN